MKLIEPSDPFLAPTNSVVEAVLTEAPEIEPHHLMLVGAHCRDVLHRSLGHTFSTKATRDLDIALALASWDSWRALTSDLARSGDTGVCYLISGFKVDLLAFGEVEDPVGRVTPPSRDEDLSVWAFKEIHAASQSLEIEDRIQIRIPTVAGYAAAKLMAWLDRSAHHETKDARDIALVLHWYAEWEEVHDRLWDSPAGLEIMLVADHDLPSAAAHLLGLDVAALVGMSRLEELLARWPGDGDLLVQELHPPDELNWSASRRRELVAGLTRGLQATAAPLPST